MVDAGYLRIQCCGDMVQPLCVWSVANAPLYSILSLFLLPPLSSLHLWLLCRKFLLLSNTLLKRNSTHVFSTLSPSSAPLHLGCLYSSPDYSCTDISTVHICPLVVYLYPCSTVYPFMHFSLAPVIQSYQDQMVITPYLCPLTTFILCTLTLMSFLTRK